MRRRHMITAVVMLMLWTSAASAGIQNGPTVARTPEGFEIAFTLDAPADVTVRIVDADGSVVRHLACGMVGLKKAAEPLQEDSLSQKLTWDGKDDAGKNADAKDCRAFVGIGMKSVFDRFILGEPNGFAGDAGGGTLIVAGPGGRYYIMQSRGTYCRSTARMLNDKGEFVRGFWPCDLAQPGAKDFLLKPNPLQCERDQRGYDSQGIDDWNGRRVPYSVCHDLTFFFHTNYSAAVATTDGYLVAVPAYAGRVRTSLWRLSPEGFPSAANWMVPWHPTSYPEAKDTPARQKALWQSGRAGGWKLAPGLDGDFYLADGIHNVVAHFRAKDFAPIDFEWSGTQKLETPRNYIGELDTQGDDEKHFNFRFEEKQPFGVTVDAKGYILVLDGDVVKTYARDGRFVEKKTRTESEFDKIYVPIRDGGLTWEHIKKAEEASLPSALVEAGRNPRALSFPGFLRIDSAGRLYLSEDRPERTVSDIDGKKLTRTNIGGAGAGKGYGYMALDSQDNLYVASQIGYNGFGRLLKYSSDGKPIPFGDMPSLDTDTLGRNVQIRGVFVARNGDIYLSLDVPPGPPFINVYAPDGALRQERLATGYAMNDVAVDRAGCIYFLEGVKTFKGIPFHLEWPPRHLTPEQAVLIPERQGEAVGPIREDLKVEDSQIIKRCSLSSRLVKMSPEGGALDGKSTLWSFAGASGLSPAEGKPERESAAQICLDPDERLWVPDPLMYCVTAVDKAGNLIARVGAYGSEDRRGGGKDGELEGTNIVTAPEIPLARPSGIAVYHDYLIISDMFSHRVARCRLVFSERKETSLAN